MTHTYFSLELTSASKQLTVLSITSNSEDMVLRFTNTLFKIKSTIQDPLSVLIPKEVCSTVLNYNKRIITYLEILFNNYSLMKIAVIHSAFINAQ